MSADGYITKHKDGLVDWSTPEDKKFFRDFTKEIGVMITGKKTLDTFPGLLPNRLHVVMTRTPDVSKNEEGKIEYTNQSPQAILENLEQRGYERVALIGGAQVNAMFLEHDLIDELYITVEPKIFGAGKRLFADIHKDVNLELVENKLLNENTLLLHYKVKR